MQILIDGTPLLLRSAGVKTYVYYWAQHLQALAPGRVRLFPFLDPPAACVHDRSVAAAGKTFGGLALMQAANRLPGRLLDLVDWRADVFHSSHQLRKPPRRRRVTATIYDMTCWLFPEFHTANNVAGSKRFAEMVMATADGLIAISEHTKQDAVRLLGLDERRVRVIYPGVAEAYFSVTQEDAEAVRRKRGLNRPYLLFVGSVEPRKNIKRLLDAWEQLREPEREGAELLIAGPRGWGKSELAGRHDGGDGRVRHLGYIPEEELPALTAGALGLVYPTLYEGFGLPAAQAMAAGTPVLTSQVSSLPEICREAAVYVDPASVESIAGGLRKLAGSESLRQSLSAAGRVQAQRFQWDDCAAQTLAWWQSLA